MYNTSHHITSSGPNNLGTENGELGMGRESGK